MIYGTIPKTKQVVPSTSMISGSVSQAFAILESFLDQVLDPGSTLNPKPHPCPFPF